MSELILRPRQVQAIHDVTQAYRSGAVAPVMVAPTGFGKTATSTNIIQRTLSKGKTVWFMAHLKEILFDTAKKLNEQKIKHGWIAAGQLGDRRQGVQVSMVQTLARRMDMYQPPDLIIIDEAHLAVANTYQKIFEWAKAGPKYYQKGGAHLLHLTATPQRLDGRGLNEIADALIPTCSTQELIDDGDLAPIKYYAPTTVDMSGVASRGGDFAQDQAAAMMDKPMITGDAVAEYTKVARHRPAIAFCVSIEHAQHVAAAFCEAGYRAVAVSGESDPIERDAALAGLRDGKLDVVCNCALYVAGVDVPAVSCIIMLSPTKSIVKFLQSIGRGLRTHPGKDCCIVLDHAGNIGRHGNPTMQREWTLSATEKKKGSKKAEVGEKKCPACFASVSNLATHCACGHEFQAMPREITQVEGDLSEIDMQAQVERERTERRKEQGKAQSLEDLVSIGRSRGMKRPELWAKHVLRARQAKEARHAV